MIFMIDKELFEKVKMNIAINNLKDKKTDNSLLEEIEWRNYSMKRKIIAALSGSLIFISGVVFATNYDRIISSFGLGKGIDNAAENGYIEYTNINYVDSNAKVKDNFNENRIENIKVEAQINDFLIDNTNISTHLSLVFDEKIKKFFEFYEESDIKLKDLIITDNEKRILYCENENVFKKFCKENNLNYKLDEYNENVFNCGINSFIEEYNEKNNTLKLTYNIYTEDEKFPSSRRLNFNFSNIELKNKNKSLNINGNWNMTVDVPENMYNRTDESYKVVNCSNDNFEVYKCIVSNTGFELGVIINNIEKPEYPAELLKAQLNIANKYKAKKSEKWAELISKSPYKEMYDNYNKRNTPIDVENNDLTYIKNSNGTKFECSMSPSRKYNREWLENNKYDFYETFNMNKYNASDKITVVLDYYGEKVIIELEK